MRKACKYRLYPTRKQKFLIQKTFGCVRFVYNYFLTQNMKLYEDGKHILPYAEMSRQLTKLKEINEWLCEPDKSALQNSLKALDNAFKKKFCEQGVESPRFKTKEWIYKSYTSTQNNGNIKIVGKRIQLPKLGTLKIRGNINPNGKIFNATISQSPTGKYYVSVCYNDENCQILPKTDKAIGLDFGLKNFITTSDGEKILFYNNVFKNNIQISNCLKQLKTKTVDGNSYKAILLKLRKIHEKESNSRKDFINKISSKIVSDYDFIFTESLSIKEMEKNKILAQPVLRSCWYEFTRQLEYKAKWKGKVYRKIDKYFPSSQLCNKCGYQNKDLKNLDIRTWTCPKCGCIHDRDVNAAINIKNEGLRLLNN